VLNKVVLVDELNQATVVPVEGVAVSKTVPVPQRALFVTVGIFKVVTTEAVTGVRVEETHPVAVMTASA
jgi:hypothetical protein